ncbi:MAG: hypothetical protein ACKVP0_18845 [Pirellulaceae bacterium]
MEIIIVAVVLGVAPIVAAICLATLRLAIARPGSIRKLSRIDLQGMFLVTSALAATLSLTRFLLENNGGINSLMAICFLPLLLPMIWLARYATQDIWEVSASKNKHENSQLDLRFLSEDENKLN